MTFTKSKNKVLVLFLNGTLFNKSVFLTRSLLVRFNLEKTKKLSSRLGYSLYFDIDTIFKKLHEWFRIGIMYIMYIT